MKFYEIEINQNQNKEKGKKTFLHKFSFLNRYEHNDIIHSLGLWCKNQILTDGVLRSKGFINKFPVILKINTDNYSESFKIKPCRSVKEQMLSPFWYSHTMISLDTKAVVKRSSLDNNNFKPLSLERTTYVNEIIRRVEISVPMGGAVKKN